LDEPVFQNPKTPRKNLRFEDFSGSPKIAGNRGKIQTFQNLYVLGKLQKKTNFETCSKNFPTGKPSHLPIISPQIRLQITKDVRSQRLAVCCHSVSLSTKKEQELGLGLESMVK
jgi:hypothetical protein